MSDLTLVINACTLVPTFSTVKISVREIVPGDYLQSMGFCLTGSESFGSKANFSALTVCYSHHPETRATLDLNDKVAQNVSFELQL